MNLLLYFETSLILGVVIIAKNRSRHQDVMKAFDGIDYSAVILIVVQTVLGLVVSRVLIYADSLAKVMIGGVREVVTLLVAPIVVASRLDWISTSAGLWVAFALVLYFASPVSSTVGERKHVTI